MVTTGSRGPGMVTTGSRRPPPAGHLTLILIALRVDAAPRGAGTPTEDLPTHRTALTFGACRLIPRGFTLAGAVSSR